MVYRRAGNPPLQHYGFEYTEKQTKPPKKGVKSIFKASWGPLRDSFSWYRYFVPELVDLLQGWRCGGHPSHSTELKQNNIKEAAKKSFLSGPATKEGGG